MGFEEDAARIQDLYLDGRHREAAAAVPFEFIDETALLGSPRERIARAAGPLRGRRRDHARGRGLGRMTRGLDQRRTMVRCSPSCSRRSDGAMTRAGADLGRDRLPLCLDPEGL